MDGQTQTGRSAAHLHNLFGTSSALLISLMSRRSISAFSSGPAGSTLPPCAIFSNSALMLSRVPLGGRDCRERRYWLRKPGTSSDGGDEILRSVTYTAF